MGTKRSPVARPDVHRLWYSSVEPHHGNGLNRRTGSAVRTGTPISLVAKPRNRKVFRTHRSSPNPAPGHKGGCRSKDEREVDGDPRVASAASVAVLKEGKWRRRACRVAVVRERSRRALIKAGLNCLSNFAGENRGDRASRQPGRQASK